MTTAKWNISTLQTKSSWRRTSTHGRRTYGICPVNDLNLLLFNYNEILQVKAQSYREVYLPIAPQVEQGTITIKIRTISQIRRQVFDIDLDILVYVIHFSFD